MKIPYQVIKGEWLACRVEVHDGPLSPKVVGHPSFCIHTKKPLSTNFVIEAGETIKISLVSLKAQQNENIFNPKLELLKFLLLVSQSLKTAERVLVRESIHYDNGV